MKHLLLLSFTFLFLNVFSQESCYTVSEIPYTPDPYEEGTSVSLGDDAFTGIIPIGFNFCFFDITYTHLIIGSNAIVSFDTSLATTACAWNSTTAIPYTTEPDVKNAIMGPWQDMNPGLGGTIKYASYGIAPFRRFVVSYDQIPMYTCTDSLFSNQIIIYESSNAIDIYIDSKYFCPTWNEGASIEGIMDSSGTEAYWVTGRNHPTQWEAFEDAYRFAPSCYCQKQSGPNLLTGRVYTINDLDCIADPDEVGISNAVVELSTGNYVWTDANGNFQTETAEGVLTVSQQPISNMNQACPFAGDYDISGASFGQLYTGLDFGNIVDESCVDLRIQEGNTGLSPCSETYHTIEYCNQGTETETDVTVVLELPLGVTIQSSSMVYNLQSGGEQAVFQVGTLTPGQCGTITFTDSIPCNTATDATLCYVYAILPNADDCVGSNNVFSACQATGNELPGNHKLVNGFQSGTGYVSSTGHMVAGNQYQLRYIIRFQNLTSEPQSNLQIIDELSPYLKIGSLVPGLSSHSYQVQAENGVLTFNFTDINLPSFTTDFEASKGFIIYNINVDTALVAGSILNDAIIRFTPLEEFESNVTEVTLQPEGIDEFSSIDFNVYPNPVYNNAFVRVSNSVDSYLLNLVDQSGRLIRTWTVQKSIELDLSDLASGIYTLRLISNEGQIVRKLIKN